MTPIGFTCLGKRIGIKADAPDFALICSAVPAAVAAVFTRSAFCGAPVILGRELIKKGKAQAFLITSGVSNVATGKEGLANARLEMKALAKELGIEQELVMPFATGVIGVQLPMEKILPAIAGAKDELGPDQWEETAEAILTTDTRIKLVRRSIGKAVLVGMAKGAGMVEPDMATMLSFWVTDADLSREELQSILKRVVDRSFNRLSIDTDTSTSDAVAIMANGLAGAVDRAEFEETFTEAAVDVTKQIAADGEGATKLIEVKVAGALDEMQARTMAKSIAGSPLVKTAVHGANANWGRVAMALGKTFDERLDPASLRISFGLHTVYRDGGPTDISDEPVEEYLKNNDEVTLTVELGLGNSSATVWGCDLTEGYISINAHYRT